MTVEVETPRGLKTGAGVMEVSAYHTLALTSEEKPGGGGLKGEAVVVDLPGRPLFVLLKRPDAMGSLAAAVTLALAPDAKVGGLDAYIDAVRKLGGWSAHAKADLPREDWPLMVRFKDINDPKSVEKVDPDAIAVKRILLETTRDDVTTGIEKRIPWIDHLDRYRSDPSNPFTSTLPDDFGGFRS
jgi:hypothetical protein